MSMNSETSPCHETSGRAAASQGGQECPAEDRSWEQAFIPHVGWLSHERDDDLIRLLRQGYFEAAEQAFFWLYLRPGDRFIDCGAHIGLYSLTAARAASRDIHITAVEANPNTVELLRWNLLANEVSAEVIAAAIWKDESGAPFLSENSGRSAYACIAFDEGAPSIAVPTFTLDRLIKQNGSNPVALIKIDVEGAEHEALSGGISSIREHLAPLVMIEFTEQNLRRRGSTTEALARQLRDLGYSLFEIALDPFRLVPVSGPWPIWNKNLFACRDLDAVEARLSSVSPENLTVARDILGRGQACDRFRDLEELDRLRELAGRAEAFRTWAEETESRLGVSREETAATLVWARKTEEFLKVSREETAAARAWAENTEALLKDSRAETADMRASAESAEAELKASQEKNEATRSERSLALRDLDDERHRNEQLRNAMIPLADFARRFRWVYSGFLYFTQRTTSEKR